MHLVVSLAGGNVGLDARLVVLLVYFCFLFVASKTSSDRSTEGNDFFYGMREEVPWMCEPGR